MADLAAAAAAAAGEAGTAAPDSQQALVDNLLHGGSQVEHYYADDAAARPAPAPSQRGAPLAAATAAAAAAADAANNVVAPDTSALAGLAGLGAALDPSLNGYAMLQAAAAAGLGAANMFIHPHALLPLESFPPPKHPSLQKPEHEDSRAKRRGPMDEMRQLVRIMVKFLPQSLQYLLSSDEPGGGNRVTEPQIKSYLKATLGDEAPQPTWGMPNGWGAYLAGGSAARRAPS